MGLQLCALSGLLWILLVQGSISDEQSLMLRNERAALLQERIEIDAERLQIASQIQQTQQAMLTERAARLELEKILTQVQSELGRAQDQLAFFEDLLPPSAHGALDIRAVQVQRHPEGLHYKILLMRSGKPVKHFVGALQFVARGRCHADLAAPEQVMVLQPLVTRLAQAESSVHPVQHQSDQTERNDQTQPTKAQEAALRLNFAQFQRGQGLLAIPQGFAPHSVTVRVLDGDIVLASKVVAL
jgi:hypothetical protein